MHKLENIFCEVRKSNDGDKLLQSYKIVIDQLLSPREIMTNYTDEAQEGVRTPGYLWHVSV